MHGSGVLRLARKEKKKDLDVIKKEEEEAMARRQTQTQSVYGIFFPFLPSPFLLDLLLLFSLSETGSKIRRKGRRGNMRRWSREKDPLVARCWPDIRRRFFEKGNVFTCTMHTENAIKIAMTKNGNDNQWFACLSAVRVNLSPLSNLVPKRMEASS